VTNPSTASVCSGTCFTLTLGNDAKSSQTLGSANFTVPPGWTVSIGPTQRVTSGTRSWNVITDVTGLVKFRALSSKDALPPGQTVSADVATGIQCGSSPNPALWGTEVKQSNDFSGQPGNDFQAAATDLTPLGGFSIPTIGTQTTMNAFAVTVTADDTCGVPKTDYSGATATLAHTLLTGATPFVPASGLKWSAGGVGTVGITPVVSETGNTLTVSDTTTGVTNTSNPFNVVDVLCPPGDCQAKNSTTNPQTLADSLVPKGGSLGVGFNSTLNFSCNSVNKAVGSFTIIDPSSYPVDKLGNPIPFLVTLTYSKSVSGSRPASSFIVCITDTIGGAWLQLQPCATHPAPCVQSAKRTNFGDLQVVLSLLPLDPWIGTG